MADSAHGRTLRLGAFVHETGQHVAAWRHPGAYAESGISFAQAADVARTAERGKFDLLFLADTAAVSIFGPPKSRGRMGKVVKFEPITLLSALAAVTSASRLGRDLDHHLHRALYAGPAVRLARPDQRRPRRLEPRHLEQ